MPRRLHAASLGVPPAGPSSIPPDITGSWQSPPGSSFTAPNPNTAMLAALTTPRLAAPCHAQRCTSAARTAPLLCRVRPDRVLLAQHFERRGCPALPRGTCDRVEKETRRGVRIDGLGGLQILLETVGAVPCPPAPCCRPTLARHAISSGRGASRAAASGGAKRGHPPHRRVVLDGARAHARAAPPPCSPQAGDNHVSAAHNEPVFVPMPADMDWVRAPAHCRPSCAARLPGAARCLLPPACLPQPHLPAPPRRP